MDYVLKSFFDRVKLAIKPISNNWDVINTLFSRRRSDCTSVSTSQSLLLRRDPKATKMFSCIECLWSTPHYIFTLDQMDSEILRPPTHLPQNEDIDLSRICSTCRKTPRSVPHSWLITRFVTTATRRLPPVEQELLTIPEYLRSPSVFNGVRVTISLVLCVCFVDHCLSFCPFSFGHCVVCSSWIYGFWLPLWYLQTLLITCWGTTSPDWY
jgi:hypothetical protein